jgi:hypothetical protein
MIEEQMDSDQTLEMVLSEPGGRTIRLTVSGDFAQFDHPFLKGFVSGGDYTGCIMLKDGYIEEWLREPAEFTLAKDGLRVMASFKKVSDQVMQRHGIAGIKTKLALGG